MSSNFKPLSNDLNRLMAAAVIDRDFCTLLLSNPTRAIGQGYYGEHFQFPVETQTELRAINATSLSEFAQKILPSTDCREATRLNKVSSKIGTQRNDQSRHFYESSA